MNTSNRRLTKSELLRRVGNIAQLGGTRHYTLAEGRGKGTAAIDVRTGSGLQFVVVPDRGLDITQAAFKGLNLAYLTPTGEAHPAFYEPAGWGWLRTFAGGLVTTCGLTCIGAPGEDQGEQLGLHGRYANSPAARVCDRSGWDGDTYRIEITGIVEEATLFGDKLRLSRTIETHLGATYLKLIDEVENFGFKPSPFTLLYHVNVGYPLLDAPTELVLAADETEPYDDHSARHMNDMFRFGDPEPGFVEQNFLHRMRPGDDGLARAAMINRELAGGLGLYLEFSAATLPYLNEWKMLGEGDYVVGVEPCNAPCANRAVLRERGVLPMLEPGEARRMETKIGILEGPEEIDVFVQGTTA
jgi:hypothetical protein